MIEYNLDMKGMRCPIPVIKAKNIIKKMKSGESFELISDDMGVKEDIPSLLRTMGCTYDLKEEGKDMVFLIQKE